MNPPVRRNVAIDADLVAIFGENEDWLSELVNRLLRIELDRRDVSVRPEGSAAAEA